MRKGERYTQLCVLQERISGTGYAAYVGEEQSFLEGSHNIEDLLETCRGVLNTSKPAYFVFVGDCGLPNNIKTQLYICSASRPSSVSHDDKSSGWIDNVGECVMSGPFKEAWSVFTDYARML